MPPMANITRADLPEIPDDQFWNITHDGSRRAQPIRVELRKATAERLAAIRSGEVSTERALAFTQVVAWDYSTGGDVEAVAERLATMGNALDRIAVGVIA